MAVVMKVLMPHQVPHIRRCQTVHPPLIHLCAEIFFYFMPHKNEESNYREIKIGAFMNNNCSSKQWVARCHMDVLIKIEIGCPLLKNNYSTLHATEKWGHRLIIGK